MKRILSLITILTLPGHSFAGGGGYGDEVVVQSQQLVDDACYEDEVVEVQQQQQQVLQAVPVYSAPVVTGMSQVYSAPIVVRQQVVRQRFAQPVYAQAAPLVVRQQGAYGYGGMQQLSRQQVFRQQAPVVFQQRRGLFGRRRAPLQGTGSIQLQASDLQPGTKIKIKTPRR
jgi:hypothetical protein